MAAVCGSSFLPSLRGWGVEALSPKKGLGGGGAPDFGGEN